MKKYSGLFLNIMLTTSSIFGEPNKEEVNEPVLFVHEDSCDQIAFDPQDKVAKLMERYDDEEFRKIILYHKLLEKNYSLYLCKSDKMIQDCLTHNDNPINFRNFIRLLNASAFFTGTAICGYISKSDWELYLRDNVNFNAKYLVVGLWITALGVAGSLLFVQGFMELKKIYLNYDQNQLYYKALAIKNALLNYRKNKINA